MYWKKAAYEKCSRVSLKAGQKFRLSHFQIKVKIKEVLIPTDMYGAILYECFFLDASETLRFSLIRPQGCLDL